uniref:C3H1-type domain-containing protein n=1 Tax=Knipowitschia caucasica TaxID=637954 RepID=A0AAV2LRA1_KNICA
MCHTIILPLSLLCHTNILPLCHTNILPLFSFEACFTVREDANPESRKQHLSRFQENPQAFWGPKARAKAGGLCSDLQDKSKLLQNKRKAVDSVDYKKFHCKRHRRGSCDLGDACRYSHDASLLDQQQ